MQRALSHYTLEEEIGRGGMGVVYRAVDTRLGRAVAIKMLPAGATTDPERNRRFIQEARSASALNHPNIVTIYEIDEEGGATFIAMELVEGAPLDEVMAGGPLPVVTALDYGMQVAAALAAAHASGIIHRDIKPGNIMITRDGRVKVLDFGLAKLIERPPAEATMTALGTRPGLIMGTAAYMSPEQAEGRPVDARSDIFSFGAVLYEMLTGKRAFAGNSDIGLITAILRDQPAPVHTVRSEVPAGVERIVERCLAKDPSARYPNAAAAGKVLGTAHSDLTGPTEAVWRRPAVAIPVAVVLLALAALGGWQMLQSRRARAVYRRRDRRPPCRPGRSPLQPCSETVCAAFARIMALCRVIFPFTFAFSLSITHCSRGPTPARSRSGAPLRGASLRPLARAAGAFSLVPFALSLLPCPFYIPSYCGPPPPSGGTQSIT
jgi:predicted Ser/Thr protein kinase